MKLDNLPFRVYGDVMFRGKCPTESLEQVTLFNRLRETKIGKLAVHPRNEQLLKGGQFRGVVRQKAEGMTPGASDVIIPGAMTFVCELKRLDRTKCKWQDGQVEYLTAAHDAGAFACVALGADAAWQAFLDWSTLCKINT